MYVTRHATSRARERLGIPKGSVEKNVAKALTAGISHTETTGSLRRYLDHLYFSKHQADNIRVMAHYIYLFQGECLITVFQLPQKYRHTVDKLMGKANG